MNAKILGRTEIVAATSAILGLFLASEPARGQRESGVASFGPKISIRVAETASANIRLRQSAEFLSAASGVEGSGQALASADFDEDGVPDLVTGYAAPRGGRLTVQRGNVDAIYPNSADANARRQRGEFTTAAFHPAAGSLALPEAADYLGGGDFDADGHWDIVAARRGGSRLYWLRGDGRGNFGEAQAVEVAGAITALETGEINRLDGLTDIAVGIIAADGPRALVYEGAEGALRRAPESFALSAPVSAFAFGQLDEEAAADLAIAGGNEVLVVHGRDRKLSLDAEQQAQVQPAKLSRSAFDAEVVSIAAGDFEGDWKQELAVLTTDGSVRVLGRGVMMNQEGRKAGKESMVQARAGTSIGTSSVRLLATKVSALPKDDLLVIGGSNAVQVITTRDADVRDSSGKVSAAGNEQLRVAASIEGADGVTAVLPMRLNADALKDLVLLSKNSGAPMVIETQAAAVFVVNTTARTTDVNPGNGVCADVDGNCSFAAAIQESNAFAGADTINFNIPGGGVPSVGTHVPSASAVFNEVTEAVTIDGTTQPGGRVEVNSDGFTPLVFRGGNSVLRGVAIYGQSASLYLASDGNIVEGNYIGFRPDGTKPSYGQIGGIYFRLGLPGNNNLIGGTVAQARNVISNCHVALSLGGTTGNVIQGNWVGLTIDGAAALPNGVCLNSEDSPVTIGGTTPGAGNVFSGADATNQGTFSVGLNISRASLIQGNKIGTTADGMQAIPMRGHGIEVFTNEAVTIGGTTPAARNIVAASFWGIRIAHDHGEATLIQGNYAGTNATGTGALPNSEAGMSLSGTRGVVIGGAASGAGNLISGNTKNGLELRGGINGTPCRGVTVQGNFIGTDLSGIAALPNLESGFYLATTENAKVGGTTAQERNLISGNAKHGLTVGDAGVTPGRIQGNFIGLNIFGTGALGNGQHGIHIENFGGHLIGGAEPGAGNIIAFNGGAGIASSFRDYLGGAILSNSIFANRGLGLDRAADGVTPYRGNYAEAPVITSVTTSGSETVISGNLRTFTFGPQGPHTIQFFSNTSPDPTGYGEGQTFIGETTITAGQNVAVPFHATVPAVPPGRYVTAVTIGEGNTQDPNDNFIYSSEFSFNVRAPGDSSNNPLQLFAVTPSVGGDTGVVTVKVIGEGIRPGATVLLRRAGEADIVGTVVSIASDGSTIEATFDLTGKARGSWEVVVTNSGGASVSVAGAFTIEQGRAPNVWADIIGRSVMRKGSPQTYHIVFGNRGNVDAPATVVRAYVTTGVVQITDVAPLPDGNKPMILPNADGTTSVVFFVPKVAAGATLTQTMKLLSPVGEPDVKTSILVRCRSSRGVQAAYETDVDPTLTISPPQIIESTDSSFHAKYQSVSSKASGEIEIAASLSEAAVEEPFTATVTETATHVNYRFSTTYKTGVGSSRSRSSGELSPDGPVTPIGKIIANAIAPKDGGPSLLSRALPQITSSAAQMTKLNQQALDKGALGGILGGPGAKLLQDTLRAGGKLDDLLGKDGNLDFRKGLERLNEGRLADAEKKLKEITQTPEDVEQRPLLEDGVCINPGEYRTYGADGIDSPPYPGCGGGNGGGSGGSGLLDIDIVTARDPNEKVGSKGQLPQHYVSGVEPMRYAIYFENQASATAPAQDVVITDQLDVSKLDLSTFELGPVHFGNNVVVTPPPGLSEWTTDIDLRPANNLIVRVLATLDKITGIATWRFTSIDPATQQPTEDPLAGFLPPNKNAPEGDGGVAFTIKAKSGLASGTEIRNKARIVFDVNPAIDTPEWLNIIDNSPPGSQVAALASTQNSSRFEVTWSGSDSTSGIASYTIYVSEDGGEFVVWLVNTTGTSGFYTGRPGATYSFYSVAQDGAGNAEAPPGPADASTTVRFGQLLNIATRLRVQTGENVLIGGLIVTGTEAKRVIIRAIGPSLSQVFNGALSDPKLELYQGDTLLASNDNWKESQQAEIEATTIPPSHELESAIVRTLLPGNYTAVVSGQDGGTGIGVIEVYDLDQAANSKLANIATRGYVDSGDNVMIGGVIAGGNGGADTRVLIRAIGPSLVSAGIAGVLQDPMLELRNANGALLRENDNWQADQQDEIEATTIPPSNAAESAIVATLTPGNYTAIVRGAGNTTGVGLVEVYNIQ